MAAIDTATKPQAALALPGLGRALVLAGKLAQKAAEDIFRKAQTSRTSFIAELMGSGAVSPKDLAHTLSHAFAAPQVKWHELVLVPLVERSEVEVLPCWEVLLVPHERTECNSDQIAFPEVILADGCVLDEPPIDQESAWRVDSDRLAYYSLEQLYAVNL